MLKRKLLFGLFILSLVALPLIASCTTPMPGEVIKLNYANFFPPTNWHSILAQLFCDEINKQTKGAVEITYFPGGTLAAAPKIADAVETGIADIGMSVTAYTMGRFPATELIDLPHNYPNGWTATKSANDYLNKFKPAEWDSVNLLYFHAHGPSTIFTTKKPVRTLDDMKGLVIRSTGIGSKIVEALGGRGHAASQGEAYELMSKGVVDGSYTPREVLKGWKQAEVVNYVTGTYAIGSTAGFFISMNKGKWDALPDSIKKIFTKVSEEWIDKHAMVWTAYDKAGIDYFLTFPDRELIELPPAEMTKFVNAAKPALDEYMAERSAKGIPVDEYEKYLNERVKHWAGKAPSENECIEWVNNNVVPHAPTK